MSTRTTSRPPLTRVRVFDLETTGIDTENARIVTGFIGDVIDDGEGGVTVENDMDLLVNPGIEIPARAIEVHGITTEHAAAHGIDPGVAATLLAASIADPVRAGIPMVGFNAPSDFTLLDRELRRNGRPPLNMDGALVVDPLVLDKAFDKFRRGKRTLEASTKYYGIRLDDAHTARADSVATGRLALLLARHPLFAGRPQDSVTELQAGWYASQACEFQLHKRRTEPDFVAPQKWPMRAFG